MTSVRRIYVDSRFRSSGTDSDFTYDLPRSIEVPEQTFPIHALEGHIEIAGESPLGLAVSTNPARQGPF